MSVHRDVQDLQDLVKRLERALADRLPGGDEVQLASKIRSGLEELERDVRKLERKANQ